MNDKELLELASKAVGMHSDHWAWDGSGMRELAVHGVPHCGFKGPLWNPLTDGGDALLLAVTLKLSTYVFDHQTEIGKFGPGGFVKYALVAHEGDASADTRRAIVLVAADIGKAMLALPSSSDVSLTRI